MDALEVAGRHARRRARLAEQARRAAQAAWDRVDPQRISQSWAAQVPALLAVITAGQVAAAETADAYLDDVLAAQGVDPAAEGGVRPSALAGVASDGRPLASLLAEAGIAVKVALSQRASLPRAMASGGFLAQLIAHTQVADAGRVADQVALTARQGAGGYVRMVVGATCSRCLILAGRWYRYNAGFKRHPKCDCVHIPSRESIAGDLRTDPKAAFAAMDRAEQDRVFTKAGAEAIREGANIGRVVNARRGMRTAADGRLYTTEAAGRRPRLMPEQIYREATDRDDAIRLLRLHGFIL